MSRPAPIPGGRARGRTGVPAALVIVTTLLLAAPAGAQDGAPVVDGATQEPVADQATPTALEADLVRRLDELLPRMRAAAERVGRTRAVRDSLRLAAEPRVETVEIAVGPLRVVTVPDQVETARRLLGSELERLGSLADADGEPLAGPVVLFQYGPRIVNLRHSGPADVVEVRSYWGEGAVRRRIREVLGGRLTRALPPLVKFWLGNAPLAFQDDPTWLYRAMILDGSRSGTACARGNAAACWASFGLSGSAEPITEWYTPEQVEELGPRRSLHGWLACNESGAVTPDRCYESFLSDTRTWSAALPYDTQLRRDFVAFAIERGGPGAWRRLLDGWPEGVAEAGTGVGKKAAPAGLALPGFGVEMKAHLAAAAGVSPDELMREWHERVMSAHPDERADLGGTRLAVAFWFLMFAALATRSTRWRLG